MQIKSFIESLVGTTEMVVEKVYFEVKSSAIIIKARLPKKKQMRCGICRCKSPLHDKGRVVRRWRCLDVGSTKVFIEAPSPRVECKEHGHVTAWVPWANQKSRFCKNFEETVAWLSVHSPKTVVAELMRIEWHTVGGVCSRVFEALKSKAPSSPLDGLVNIGIDETSYKKGHKYMTVVINHDTSAVIWCAMGHGEEVLKQFFELLSPEQRASIACVSADGARWITSCVEKYCPNAERCVDPFHVVSWATEALDSVRREAWNEAQKATQSAPKRRRGRPSKEEEVNTEKKSSSHQKYEICPSEKP